MLKMIGDYLTGGANLIVFLIALPALWGALLLLFQKRHTLQLIAAVLASALNLLFAWSLSAHDEFFVNFSFISAGFEFRLHVYGLSSLFLTVTAIAFFLLGLYTVTSLKNEKYGGYYLTFLYIGLSMVNGAVLSDSLGIMLFFGEGLFSVLAVILLINHSETLKTFVKTLTISGLSNLLLMLGIMVTEHTAGGGIISEFKKLPVSGSGTLGFTCMVLGSLGLIGCMPFHSWIPDAADDAPTVFMAAFPGTLLKIFGGCFLTCIFYSLYSVVPYGTASILLMALGALTAVFAASMAIVQHDLKRMVSYIAVSQIGYAVIGYGTGTSSGITGGLYALLGQVIFIAGLFMICGILEKSAGTTELKKLGGLFQKMPVTAICFLVLALSTVGFPYLGSYFSNLLIFSAAEKAGVIFNIAMVLATSINGIAFFKAGHAVFFEKPEKDLKPREAGFGRIVPACVLSAICLVSVLALPALQRGTGTESVFSGTSASVYIGLFLLSLLLAGCVYAFGYKKAGCASGSTDCIERAPVLRGIYKLAKAGRLDPYNWFLGAIGAFSDLCFWIEHGVSWFYDKAVPGLVTGAGLILHRFDNGLLSRYLCLAVGGVILVAAIFLMILL